MRKKSARVLVAFMGAVAALVVAVPSAVGSDSMAVFPDGKVALAGTWTGGRPGLLRGAMVRFNPDGSLDRSFGADGGLVDFRGTSPLGPIAIDPAGGLVASTEGKGFLLRRYRSDGSPDPTFGHNGVAQGPVVQPGQTAFPSALLAWPNGGLMVAGKTASTTAKAAPASGAVAQLFEPDGSFFETVGRLSEPIRPEVRETVFTDALPWPDGSLVAVGWSNKLTPDAVLLARLRPGTQTNFDTTFAGGAGVALFRPLPESSRPTPANAVVASGGRIVTVGAGLEGFLLVGFDGHGVLDKSFGDEGVARPPISGYSLAEATAAAVQPDGKIVVAGRGLGSCQDTPASECWSLIAARFRVDGSIDTAFGVDGFAQVAYSQATGLETGRIDVAIGADGKAIFSEVTGGYRSPAFMVARLNPNGSIDSSFGGGVVTVRPCQGSVSRLRRTGCFSTARVALRTAGLRRGGPGLRLTVRASQSLDPLRNVRLLLPGGLRGRQGHSSEVKALADDGRRVKALVKSREIALNRLGWSRSVSLIVPAGALRRVGGADGTSNRKLTFRVQVWFKDGSRQTFRLRRPG